MGESPDPDADGGASKSMTTWFFLYIKTCVSPPSSPNSTNNNNFPTPARTVLEDCHSFLRLFLYLFRLTIPFSVTPPCGYFLRPTDFLPFLLQEKTLGTGSVYGLESYSRWCIAHTIVPSRFAVLYLFVDVAAVAAAAITHYIRKVVLVLLVDNH